MSAAVASSSGFFVSRMRVKPKSSSLLPDLVSMILPGFKSRWTTPRRCAASRAKGDFDGVAERGVFRERTFLQAAGQGLAFEVLEDQEVCVILASDVVERADVGMVQAGDGTRFAL